MLGWYFSNTDETLRYGDGREIAVGVTHTTEGAPILCRRGLHASKTVYDALQYAPGPILWRVELGGIIVHGVDKSVATERTYLARLDATDLLRRFALSCAADVLHMWDAPEVVKRYLATGDESMRAAARAAVRATRDAARAAAWDAACNAALYAARAAARDPAQFAARAAALDAALDAAQAAAWDAAQAAAKYEARDAAIAKQNRRLAAMVADAMGA